GWSALHLAARPELAAMLLDADADINARNRHKFAGPGNSPLSAAVYQQRHEVIRLLIEHGADVNQGDNAVWTPLHLAAASGYVESVCFSMPERIRTHAPAIQATSTGARRRRSSCSRTASANATTGRRCLPRRTPRYALFCRSTAPRRRRRARFSLSPLNLSCMADSQVATPANRRSRLYAAIFSIGLT